MNAAWALGEFRARAAIKVLLKGLTDRDRFVRFSSALALGRIGCRDAAVLAALNRLASGDEELFVCVAAKRALEELGA